MFLIRNDAIEKGTGEEMVYEIIYTARYRRCHQKHSTSTVWWYLHVISMSHSLCKYGAIFPVSCCLFIMRETKNNEFVING